MESKYLKFDKNDFDEAWWKVVCSIFCKDDEKTLAIVVPKDSIISYQKDTMKWDVGANAN